MGPLGILVVKWAFVFGAIWIGFYHYTSENQKISLISKSVNDPKLISGLKSSARKKMFYLIFLFTAFIGWIMSYDILIENAELKNVQLTKELDQTSKKIENLTDNQLRLVEASKQPNQEIVDDIKTYYTDIFVNYYVMRKCDMTDTDDVFIINSALVREIGLNGLSFSLREQIISDAKTHYLSKFSNFQCEQIYGRYNNIIKNYQNYIIAVREVLRATF
jgi:hypothetical protein